MAGQVIAGLWARLQQAVHLFRTHSLFRNAVYLMLSTAIMSVLGFGFWIFVAHLYTPDEIGAASALISIALLISYISYLGLNASLVRFLAKSEQPSGDINASIIAVGSVAMLASVVVLLVAGKEFSDGLGIFTQTLVGRLAFVVLMAVVAVNTLTDSVFIAWRRAEFHTLTYAVFGVVKLVMPVVLLALGSLGVFLAFISAAAVSLALSLYIMWRSCGYQLRARPNWKFISESRHYTANNYVANILTALPGQLMPSIVLTHLGAAQTAYFSMAWTMVNLLYVVPSAVTNSLLAESSHDLQQQSRNLSHAIRLLATVLVPAVVLAVAVAPYLLELFGRQYAVGGAGLFQVLAVSTFFLAANSIGTTIMNLERRSGSVVVVQAVIAAATLGLSQVLLGWGLEGMGLAILGGTMTGTLIQLLLLSRARSQQPVLDANGQVVYTGPSDEVIGTMLETFGLAGAERGQDIGGGDRSGTWLVEQAGRRYVLKMYAASKRSRQQLQQELDFMERLQAGGIPVPRLLPAGQTNERLATVTHARVTWYGILMSFERGRHADDYTEKLIDNMARVQAQIHCLGEQAPVAAREGLVHKDGSFRSGLMGFLPKGLSHFDYYKGNVLSHYNTVTCVIDFEGLRYDPLIVCLFFTLSDVYAESRQLSYVSRYVSAYQAGRPLSRLEQAVLRLALVLRFRKLHFGFMKWDAA